MSHADARTHALAMDAADPLRPFRGELDPIMEKMWQLERMSMYRDMSTVGVDIVPRTEDARLDQTMRLLPRHRRTRRVRR